MKIRRALISVHDKTGVVELARGLHGLGVEIVSTGGTARLLRESGIPVREVADVTGFPEMLDGRVKTLHPKLHGGILARRDVPEHLAALDKHGIPAIDLVVVALYPFEATVARPGVTLDEAIEQIDVGGPAMIRAAAKNHGSVGVVTDPAQYGVVLDEIEKTGALSVETRSRLAREAFGRTAQYDAAIADYLLGGPLRLPPRPPSSRVDRAVGEQAYEVGHLRVVRGGQIDVRRNRDDGCTLLLEKVDQWTIGILAIELKPDLPVAKRFVRQRLHDPLGRRNRCGPRRRDPNLVQGARGLRTAGHDARLRHRGNDLGQDTAALCKAEQPRDALARHEDQNIELTSSQEPKPRLDRRCFGYVANADHRARQRRGSLLGE